VVGMVRNGRNGGMAGMVGMAERREVSAKEHQGVSLLP
jgi:hypothetical protein